MSPDGAAGNGDGAIIEAAASDPTADVQADTTTTTTAAADQVIDSGERVASEGEPAGTDAPSDDDAAAADAADLAQYPEELRDDELFKSLAPEKRKRLYEMAETRANDRIEANRKKTEALEAQQKAQEARRAEIRARTGKFVGAEAQTIELPDGTQIELPSRDEMVELSRTQRGRDKLRADFGLDEQATEFWVGILDRNREALDAAADLLDDRAWAKLDGNLRDGIRSNGFDPDEILADARSPHDVISQLVGHLKTTHDAEMKKQKDHYEGRLATTNANAEGLRPLVAAAKSRELPTGGRTAGSAGGQSVADRLIAEAGSVEEYIERAKRGEYRHLKL